MASSRNLRLTDLPDRVAALLAPLLPAHRSILIGLSGGVDSVVLLHLLHRLAPRFSWQLSALHVHHGISPNADAWAKFCAELCARCNIPLHIEYVDITPLRRHGTEAAARKLRLAAFAAQPCDVVALAHHADDQAETLLLQLLRGAGIKGAAAMPVLSPSKWPVLSPSQRPSPDQRAGSPRFLRPLLHCSRQEILDYAALHQLQWIEDESNADENYPRNFLRGRVLPLLTEKFPAYRHTLTRSAQHFAEASDLLDELAKLDAQHSILPTAEKSETGRDATLEISALRNLTLPRAKNLLRYFFQLRGVTMPQAAQLDDMLRQLCGARADAAVCISVGHAESSDWSDCNNFQVRRYQGKVYVLRAPGEFKRNFVLPWHGEAELDWPALNVRLGFQHRTSAGVSLAKLQQAPVTLRLRSGGATLRPQPNAATRTLKNLLQEHHTPPWQRDRLPLLYCGDDLVCVPGVAIAAEYQAAEGETGVSVSIIG